MPGRFRHYGHVLRVAVLFAIGVGGFLVVRHVLVPSDFGRFGFYRAGALNDVKAKPIAYAGCAACEESHAGTYDPPDDAKKPAADTVITTAGLSWPVDKDVDNKHALLN